MKNKRVYVCYQAEYRSILGIATTVEKAQEICSETDDAYVEIELDKNYGRDSISTDDVAVYNINGEFKTSAQF